MPMSTSVPRFHISVYLLHVVTETILSDHLVRLWSGNIRDEDSEKSRLIHGLGEEI